GWTLFLFEGSFMPETVARGMDLLKVLSIGEKSLIRSLNDPSTKEPTNCFRHDDELYQPSGRVRRHKNSVQLHKCSIGEDQWQRADHPYCNRKFECARYRMKAQPSGDISKDSTCQEWQRTGQSNRLPFGTLTPDFRVRVSSMNPISCEEPISERRD